MILISMIAGSAIFFYLNQSGFFGFNISQIPYDEVQQQTTTITFTGDTNQSDFDLSSWSDLGEFLQNLSYGFYDDFSLTQDLPFIPPIDPALAPAFIPLLESIIFNATPADPPKYWKMTSYDYYDGESWQKTSSFQNILNTISLGEVPVGAQIFNIYMNISHSIQGNTLIPILSPNQLIITDSINMAGNSTILGLNLNNDSYGSAILDITFSSEGLSTISYQVTFLPLDLISVQTNSLGSLNTPSSISSIYLQLPTTRNQYLNDNPLLAGNVSLFEAYAQSNSVYDTALQVLGYFKSNFVYDPFASYPGGNLDRVEWFFENGGGSSLDFATAYSIFLRCLNISARTVYGFLPGEQVGNTRVIRGWNVHLWNEIWNPTSSGEDNWIQFDPTPLSQNITDIIGEDPYISDVDYSLITTVENNPIITITRGTSFELEAYLTNNSIPMEGYLIEFYDEAEQYIIANATTDSSGTAVTNFSYNNSAKIGAHPIRAYSSSLPLIRNYSMVLIDGSTSITIDVLPNPPQNVTRNLYSISISGILTDSLNGQPIADQTIRIIVDSLEVGTTNTNNLGQYDFIYTPTLLDENKNTVVQALFDGSFSTVIEGIPFTFPPTPLSPSSNNDNVDIVASTTVTTEVNTTAAVPGEWIRIYGVLTYDVGSPYPSQSIEIYWRDSSGEQLLATRNTDGTGFYFYDYQIPSNTSGEVKIFSIFYSLDPYVLGSYTDPTIYVGEEKITQLSSDFNYSLRGNVIHISGLLTNISNDPLPGRNVITQFYFNQTQTLVDSYTTITNQSGYFSFDYAIPIAFQVGTFLINCTTTSPVIVASEQLYIDIISTTSISFDINPIFVVPGENFSIIGQIVDDNNQAIDSTLSFYLGGQLIRNISTLNGNFNITQLLPLGISSSTYNVTLIFNGEIYYQNTSTTRNVLVFTSSTVEVTVDPNIITPGGNVFITVSATDNYGRNIYQREVLLFINNTFIMNLTLSEGAKIIQWVVPADSPNGPVIIYGILDTDVQSNYISDTLTIQEFMAMQATDIVLIIVIIVVIAVVSIIGYYFYKKRGIKTKVTQIDIRLPDKIIKLKNYVSSRNKKEAVILTMKIIEELAAGKYNILKKPYQTVREYSTEVIDKTDLNSRALYELTKAFEKIKYSKSELDDSEFNQAVQHFRVLYNQLTGDDFSIG
jgi:hypothetical protein